MTAMWRKFILLAFLLPALPACETEDVCDGVDNDGDGYFDEDHTLDEVIRPFYVDADGDGYGDVDFVVSPPTWACAAPEGLVANNLDCDDTDSGIHPDTPEVCNGIDDDCNLMVDENVGDTYFTDADGDGYGDPDAVVVSCDEPSGVVTNGDDCDDGEATAYPGNTEVCDGVDNDCDGDVPADETTDADADGSLACEDCDDEDPARTPGAVEECDGVDNDCDGDVPADEVDADGDGFLACAECEDNDATQYPGALELCDGVDSNCDGYMDTGDFDGSGTADCEEVLVVVSYPFAEITDTCVDSGLSYPETEFAAVEAAAAELGLGAVSVAEGELAGLTLEDLAERPVVMVLNGGLPWADPFFDDTLDALMAANDVGIPVYFVGDDAADGVDDHPALATLLGLEAFTDSGVADSVNVLDAGHPVVHGPYGDVQGFWCDADMDVVDLGPGGTLVAEQATTGTPVIAVTDGSTRTAVQLFGAAASHDMCPQAPDTRTDPLLRNTLEWLLE